MRETIEESIPAVKIASRVREIAGEIIKDYDGKPIIIIGILKGAFVFIADLARELEIAGANIEGIDFLRASSYGTDSVSSGDVRIDMDISIGIHGKNVLLIEDIVDTGNTLAFLRDYIKMKKPASIKICALLDKPDRRTAANVEFEYVGFKIPDDFVVGYGLDYAQRHRNLPYIGILHFEEEENE